MYWLVFRADWPHGTCAHHSRYLLSDISMLPYKSITVRRLDIDEGELPPAFEAEERSHPDASRDLLHLVSGRTLLGVVREQQQMHLEGKRGTQDLMVLPCT